MTQVLQIFGMLLTVLSLSLGVMELAPKAAAGEPLVSTMAHSPGFTRSVHQGTGEGANSRSCVPAGPCGSLPQKTAAPGVRCTIQTRSLPAPTTDMVAPWDLPPPDQPPRSLA